MTLNDGIQDEKGRGYCPSRLDRLSRCLTGDSGLGMLVLVFGLALLTAAFVVGMNVGYDMATVSLSQQAAEVLR